MIRDVLAPQTRLTDREAGVREQCRSAGQARHGRATVLSQWRGFVGRARCADQRAVATARPVAGRGPPGQSPRTLRAQCESCQPRPAPWRWRRADRAGPPHRVRRSSAIRREGVWWTSQPRSVLLLTECPADLRPRPADPPERGPRGEHPVRCRRAPVARCRAHASSAGLVWRHAGSTRCHQTLW